MTRLTKNRPFKEVFKNATSKGVTVAVNSTARTTMMSHLRKNAFCGGRGRGGTVGGVGGRGDNAEIPRFTAFVALHVFQESPQPPGPRLTMGSNTNRDLCSIGNFSRLRSAGRAGRASLVRLGLGAVPTSSPVEAKALDCDSPRPNRRLGFGGGDMDCAAAASGIAQTLALAVRGSWGMAILSVALSSEMLPSR